MTARQFWRLHEPIHDMAYFAPEVASAGVALGLPGFWATYFAFRAAPLGRCTPEVVVATFFGFAADPVHRALPAAWEICSPEEAEEARRSSAARALRRHFDADAIDANLIEPIADRLWEASQGLETAGRPLAAANQALRRPSDAVERVWQASTTLREYRGDGHIAALVSVELGPAAAHLVKVAAGEADEEWLKRARCFTDDAWAQGWQTLSERGLVEHTLLTDEGARLHAEVESLTDRLAEPTPALTEVEVGVLGRLAEAVIASGELPDGNPVGLGQLSE